MEDLIQQEKFEMEVLDRLQSRKMLSPLVFTGGTMLRLCFGLNRFSVDLDFWFVKKVDQKKFFSDLKKYLSEHYALRDAANKFHTLLYEIKSRDYPRSLKIEIRKFKEENIKTQQAIAYSPDVDKQVLLQTVSLEDMMTAKLKALCERKEIRDAFDLEFLFKKGVGLTASEDMLRKALVIIEHFSKRDYTVKLGSLLPGDQRQYYLKENFKILRMAINDCLFMRKHTI